MSITRTEFINRVGLHLEVVSGTESVPADMSTDVSNTLNSCLAYLARIENFHEPDPANTIRDEAINGLVPYVSHKCYSILQSPRAKQEVMLEAQEGLVELRRLTEPSDMDSDRTAIHFF